MRQEGGELALPAGEDDALAPLEAAPAGAGDGFGSGGAPAEEAGVFQLGLAGETGAGGSWAEAGNAHAGAPGFLVEGFAEAQDIGY